MGRCSLTRKGLSRASSLTLRIEDVRHLRSISRFNLVEFIQVYDKLDEEGVEVDFVVVILFSQEKALHVSRRIFQTVEERLALSLNEFCFLGFPE